MLKEKYKEDMVTVEEMWDEVISDWFPNADPDEIEEEHDSFLKD